jgi:hypothetical protein
VRAVADALLTAIEELMNDSNQGDHQTRHNAIDVERLVKRFGTFAAVDGLDLPMEELFQRCVREAAAQGRTALSSSHILAEVEQLCASVTIIKDGRLVESGLLADMRHPPRRRSPRGSTGEDFAVDRDAAGRLLAVVLDQDHLLVGFDVLR